VVETRYSKSQAQTRETLLADAWGCESHPGGDGPEFSTWHVYYFQHDGYLRSQAPPMLDKITLK